VPATAQQAPVRRKQMEQRPGRDARQHRHDRRAAARIGEDQGEKDRVQKHQRQCHFTRQRACHDETGAGSSQGGADADPGEAGIIRRPVRRVHAGPAAQERGPGVQRHELRHDKAPALARQGLVEQRHHRQDHRQEPGIGGRGCGDDRDHRRPQGIKLDHGDLSRQAPGKAGRGDGGPQGQSRLARHRPVAHHTGEQHQRRHAGGVDHPADDGPACLAVCGGHGILQPFIETRSCGGRARRASARGGLIRDEGIFFRVARLDLLGRHNQRPGRIVGAVFCADKVY